jgi:hypothetical protein
MYGGCRVIDSYRDDKPLHKKVSMKIKNIVTVLLIALILASCAPAAKVVPIETAAPTSTFMPVPLTSTVEPPPTAELPLEQQPATILAAKALAASLSQAGISTTQEQIIQQGLTVTQREGLDLTDATGTSRISYEIAYTLDGFPLMIKIGDGEWKPANFENNPYGIVFGYTERLEPKSPAIANMPASQLFSLTAKYATNHSSPARCLDEKTTFLYDGTPASQESFFIDGQVDIKGLRQFVESVDTEFKGIIFSDHPIMEMPQNNPNGDLRVISGQNQIQGQFEIISDPIVVEEAFVWYLTNTTRAAIKNNVHIFTFNELMRDDNYWINTMYKTPSQITELAIQTVRLVAGENPDIKFLINDADIDKSTKSSLGRILKIIEDFDKRGIVKPGELVIGIEYHNQVSYDVANLNNVFEKLYEAGIRDIRLTEVDILGKQEPTDEQILRYYTSLIQAIKEQKKAHPDVYISVVFFDEAWGGSYLGQNTRITDVPNGLYQVLVELYK